MTTHLLGSLEESGQGWGRYLQSFGEHALHFGKPRMKQNLTIVYTAPQTSKANVNYCDG